MLQYYEPEKDFGTPAVTGGETVELTIDGVSVAVPAGTSVMHAAAIAGIKVPKLCATVLRHSFAHHRLVNGQDALTVAELLGHKGTDMLAKRYGKIGQNREYMSREANRIAFPSLRIPDSPPVVSP